jgi:predicted ABC-type ATPase
MPQRVLEIIGGPNGSGKTTFAESALLKKKNALYINSDSIARGLTLNGNKHAQYEAGRFMLNQINECFKNNFSFSFETTLSGKIWINHIKKAKDIDYKVVTYFVFVDNIELSLERIKNRVKNGGHDIPKDIVKRRFKRTFSNFINIYAPLSDEWHIINNTKKPQEIAYKKGNKLIIINQALFEKLFI